METSINESNAKWNTMSSSEYDQNLIDFGATVTPIYLSITDKENKEYRSKCTSMTLDFGDIPQIFTTISFKNYYTYTISVLIMKVSYTDSDGLKKWYIAMDKKVS